MSQWEITSCLWTALHPDLPSRHEIGGIWRIVGLTGGKRQRCNDATIFTDLQMPINRGGPSITAGSSICIARVRSPGHQVAVRQSREQNLKSFPPYIDRSASTVRYLFSMFICDHWKINNTPYLQGVHLIHTPKGPARFRACKEGFRLKEFSTIRRH